MSVSGISNNNNITSQLSNPVQLSRGQFQQLGQDLATGNLSSAKSDFATLQQTLSQIGSNTSATAANSKNSNFNPITTIQNPVTQTLQQLSNDLQSGNLTGAQKDYSTLQHLQSTPGNPPHHGLSGGPIMSLLGTQNQATGTVQNSLNPVLQSYATLAQQLQQDMLGGGSGSAGVSALNNPISMFA